MSPRARDIKERINKWDFIKIKSFCTAKENISTIKRVPTVWENIFVNDTSDKGLISKIHKNSYNSTLGRQKAQLKNWQRLEQILLQEGHAKVPETYERMLSITSHQRDAN